MKYENKNIDNLNKEEILKFIQNNHLGSSFLEIVKKLKIQPTLNSQLSIFLKQLIDEEKIEINREQKYLPIFYLKTVKKPIAITNKRLGFIDLEESDHKKNKAAILFPFQIRNLLNGDLVEAKIFYYYNEKNEILYKAKITKLIEHKKNIITGIITKNLKNHFVFEAINDKDKANFEIINYIHIPKNITEKDLVEVEILEPNNKFVAIKFKKILDRVDNFDYPFKKIFSENEIELNFPTEVLEKAKKLPQSVSENEIKKRHDLRNLLTVTIDGLDTKDFDDAISCYTLANKNTKLFIHIADVSYYVEENDEIDKEALRRGTSIYLPDKVIPMLPFELSNGICSLNPHVDRCTITLELEIDSQGKNVDTKIYESVINSNYRLTYNEVNDYFNNKINLPNEIKNILDSSRSISSIIRKNKLLEGYVNFEIKEPKIIIQDNKVIDIKLREEGESENMIEDFMVRANETIAAMMHAKKIPSIYRIHDKPSDEKLLELQELIKFANLKDIAVPFDGEPLSFAKMVEKIKTRKLDEYMKSALLKTMQKAIYSSKNIGHFGLASKFYSHFTSPIRRYPDLLLHRLIKKYLFTNKEFSEDEFKQLNTKIEEIAQLNSESEKIAMSVERDIVDIRKAEFFEELKNKIFNATLISIEKFGVFLNIYQYQTSVLIHFDELDDEIKKISNFEAKGKKYHFKVGKEYKIQILGIERIKGNINAKLC
ncbi:ribonuclease R [Metamycoplasma alkalescens]|uniref:Ribonuclease R n=1 Tax=Metamycoplasma alkalescens TaxID=45363 RepID=A0A318U9M7_9BACT|nr:ribonuclease R [Metamycoplasma alkalescens]PYF43183.1 ribonuclease R [Metamycoplasma alkalescens]SYV90056.1 VacB-like exoribonuclease II [Metamycoplasma alkalescens]